jgi:antitoxin component YwqK of YwqJK toxin-antitoxin module
MNIVLMVIGLIGYMRRVLLAGLVLIVTLQTLWAQQPPYTPKKFVATLDLNEFEDIVPGKEGFSRTYLSLSPEYFDLDDNNQTYVRGVGKALVCVEGPFKDGSKNGLFTFYLIDSLDHSRRYKIWEQELVNDRITGQWRIFTLKGTLLTLGTYKSGVLHGPSKDFRIDGTLEREREYVNGDKNYTLKEYSKTGALEKETTYADGVLNGPGRKYYPNRIVMEEVNLKNGELDGRSKYYYPSGIVWMETEYKGGKPWNIIANYDEKGSKRSAGTLKEGTGTIVYYNDDGTVRETMRFQNGIQIN